jgi:pimeloyl-ACP methyl ester carboxylesterase
MLQRAYIQTPAPQEQIHARYMGEAGPFVFFLHQWPLSSTQFARVMPLLAPHYRVYGLDAPGYGMSPSTLTQQTFVEYARRLLDAIDALKAERFVLVGAEIGAAAAAAIAHLAAPGRVRRLIALAVPPVDAAGHRAFLDELGEAKPQQDGSHLAEIHARLERHLGPEASQLRMAFTETMNIYARYHWGLRAYASHDLAADLRALTCPTLFLSAEHDPMARHAPAAAALVPGASQRTIAGAHATPAWTAPESFAAAFAEFVSG